MLHEIKKKLKEKNRGAANKVSKCGQEDDLLTITSMNRCCIFL
jgi:hypothetical protein